MACRRASPRATATADAPPAPSPSSPSPDGGGPSSSNRSADALGALRARLPAGARIARFRAEKRAEIVVAEREKPLCESFRLFCPKHVAAPPVREIETKTTTLTTQPTIKPPPPKLSTPKPTKRRPNKP